ncbi:hypothetical protein GCM10007967_17990 [Xylanimonas ulmi]
MPAQVHRIPAGVLAEASRDLGVGRLAQSAGDVRVDGVQQVAQVVVRAAVEREHARTGLGAGGQP